MTPLTFSVVIPVAKDSPWLDEAVRSTLLAATSHAAEIVVIGDGIELKNRWGRRVRVRQQERLGISAALNEGMRSAEGKYVVRMDADDVSHPDRFGATSALIASNPGASLFAGGIVKFGEVRRPKLERPPLSSRDLIEGLLHGGYAIAHPSVVFNRQEILAAGGYKLGLEGVEDLDLWLRVVLAEGLDYAATSVPVVFYRVHGEQASSRVIRSREVIDRISQEELASSGCSLGCPGRLESLRREVNGSWSNLCPSRRSVAGIRHLLNEFPSSPAATGVSGAPVIARTARELVAGARVWKRESQWFDLI